MNLPLVTVMIPAFNQSAVIGEAIESAASQDYPALEVVISDDASSDGTGEVAARFAADERIRCYRNTRNLGRVANYRRLLYELARGEWIINLDGDDCFLDPRYISKAMGLGLGDPEVVLVFAKAAKGAAKDADLTILNAQFGQTRVLDGTRFCLDNPPYGRVAPLHATTLYRREEALAERFYELDVLSSDFDSFYRLMLGRKIGFVDTVAALWRQHDANATTAPSCEQLCANFAVLERVCRNALDKNCLTARQAEQWLRKRAARMFLSTLKQGIHGRCAPTTPIGLATFLLQKVPGFVLELPAAIARRYA